MGNNNEGNGERPLRELAIVRRIVTDVLIIENNENNQSKLRKG